MCTDRRPDLKNLGGGERVRWRTWGLVQKDNARVPCPRTIENFKVVMAEPETKCGVPLSAGSPERGAQCQSRSGAPMEPALEVDSGDPLG